MLYCSQDACWQHIPCLKHHRDLDRACKLQLFTRCALLLAAYDSNSGKVAAMHVAARMRSFAATYVREDVTSEYAWFVLSATVLQLPNNDDKNDCEEVSATCLQNALTLVANLPQPLRETHPLRRLLDRDAKEHFAITHVAKNWNHQKDAISFLRMHHYLSGEQAAGYCFYEQHAQTNTLSAEDTKRWLRLEWHALDTSLVQAVPLADVVNNFCNILFVEVQKSVAKPVTKERLECLAAYLAMDAIAPGGCDPREWKTAPFIGCNATAYLLAHLTNNVAMLDVARSDIRKTHEQTSICMARQKTTFVDVLRLLQHNRHNQPLTANCYQFMVDVASNASPNHVHFFTILEMPSTITHNPAYCLLHASRMPNVLQQTTSNSTCGFGLGAWLFGHVASPFSGWMSFDQVCQFLARVFLALEERMPFWLRKTSYELAFATPFPFAHPRDCLGKKSFALSCATSIDGAFLSRTRRLQEAMLLQLCLPTVK